MIYLGLENRVGLKKSMETNNRELRVCPMEQQGETNHSKASFVGQLVFTISFTSKQHSPSHLVIGMKNNPPKHSV